LDELRPQWYDRLAPLLTGAREQLRKIEPSRLAQRSGCAHDPDGAFRLTFFWRDYLVRPPDLTIERRVRFAETLRNRRVQRLDTGKEPSDFTQALILTYLVTADGTTPSGRWIAYRDLPGGMFYAQAFRGYAEERLVRELGDRGLEAFCRGAEQLHGESVEIGTAGYSFQILPRIRLAAAYWLGDEDFSSQASILFEDTASHYMSTDGLAILGSRLVDAIVLAALKE